MGGRIVVHDAGGISRAGSTGGTGQRPRPARRRSAVPPATAAAAATVRQRRVHAPDLDGLYGRPVPLADGRDVIADERYMRDSHPRCRAKDVVAGYEPVMPSFAGQLERRATILALIAYIKSLRHQEGRSDEHARSASRLIARASGYLVEDGYTLRSWLLTTTTSASPSCTRVGSRCFFFIGGVAAALIRLELVTPAGRPRDARHLQQAVHAARRDHGLVLPDPVDPADARATSCCR